MQVRLRSWRWSMKREAGGVEEVSCVVLSFLPGLHKAL
jgi:hypothetical protein